MRNGKTVLGVVATILISLFFTACTLTPADYCETIIGDCNQLETHVKELSKQIAAKDYTKAQEVYDKNLKEIDKTIASFQKMGDCQGKTYLIDAALDFANTYKSIYENQYATYLEILKKEKKTYEDGDRIALSVSDVAESSLKAKENLVKSFFQFVKEFDLNASY